LASARRVVPDPPRDSPRLYEALTPRELEVLGLVADGLRNREIAERLGVTEHTVKFHLAAVFGKLGATTRTDAVRRGFRLGLIQL
jgi:DNA-binding CsgD family transcriptional regulator